MTIYLDSVCCDGNISQQEKQSGVNGFKTFGKQLLVGASASALSIFLASSASAQVGPGSIPAECVPNTPMAGDTIVCTAPVAGGTIGPITTNVDDLTIIVGDDATPTTVNNVAGDGISSNVNAGDLTINTENASILGSVNGIIADNGGYGAITINATDVTGANGFGINASGLFGGDGISITTSGDVIGGTTGIQASHFGASNLEINVNNVTANNGAAINANSMGEDLLITGTGIISGTNSGIVAINVGFGSNVINVNNVSGGNGVGISVSGINGNIITATGDVQGTIGIDVVDGGASTIINVNNVTGTTGRGISVGGVFAGSAIDITAVGDVRGATDGIYARSSGIYTGTSITGLMIDTSLGTVSGASNGIFAIYDGAGSLTIITADVEGTNCSAAYLPGTTGNGIFAEHIGADALTIDTSAGSVTGDAVGINATNNGSGELSITVDDVTGGSTGILASSSYGSTTITLTSTADVTGTAGGQGILATSTGSNADITVQGNGGNIIGASDGLNIDTMGGDILVQNLDSVTGQFGDAIDVSSIDGDITIAGVSTVSGGTGRYGGNGIYATSNSGDISIQGIGFISGPDGTNPFFRGISARTETGNINIGDMTAIGDVSSSGVGIYANANGNITIDTTTSNVASISTRGGNLSSATAGVDIATAGVGVVDVYVGQYGKNDINIDTLAGNAGGIVVTNRGIGSVNVTSADIAFAGNSGIIVNSGFAGFNNETSNVTIDTSAGSLTANYNGIVAFNSSLYGSLSITTADVTSLGGSAIQANVLGGNGLDVDTQNGDVIGNNNGISLALQANGDLNLSTANVNATYGNAIFAENSGGQTGDLNIDTSLGSITGGQSGIIAMQGNAVSGDINITTADVTGGDFNVIEAVNTNLSNNGNIIINTISGTLTAGNGVVANNINGDISITTADVNATLFNAIGISAMGGGAIDIDTSAGSLILDTLFGGFSQGINATITGEDNLNITTADVYGAGFVGIFGIGGTGSTGDVNINTAAGTVSGRYGIAVQQFGAGSINVTTADVMGGTGDGVFAGAFNGSVGNVIVDTTAGTVSGGRNGIFAGNNGTGGINITTADVISTATNANPGSGINADNRTLSTGDLVINSMAGIIVSGNIGIEANNYGTGSIDIDATNVIGAVGDGILATNGIRAGQPAGMGTYGPVAGGNNISITSTGDVIGATNGINSYNLGTGSTEIIANNVTGVSGDAIIAINNVDTTGLNITVNGIVTGSNAGITAVNQGAGDISIDSSGGTVTGVIAGIDITNSGSGNTSLTLGDVTGEQSGVLLQHNGMGEVDINFTESSRITGTNGIGIRVFASNSSINNLDGQSSTVSGNTDGLLISVGGPLTITNFDNISAQNGYGVNVSVFDGGLTISNIDMISSTSRAGIDGQVTDGDILIENINSITSTPVTYGGISSAINIRTIRGFNNGVIGEGGSITIQNIGDITAGDAGIVAVANGGEDVGININTAGGTITSLGRTGIEAGNFGGGINEVITGDVTSITGEAIRVTGAINSGGIVVDTTAGEITGGTFGLYASNSGFQSDLMITTGDITGQTMVGINVELNAQVRNAIIDSRAGVVTGGTNGINIRSFGDGLLDLTTATVNGGTNGINITTFGLNDGVNIDSSAGTVMGSTNGINVSNGSSDISITTADVTGVSGIGINISSDMGSVFIDSSAGSVTGDNFGILVTGTPAVTDPFAGASVGMIMPEGFAGAVTIITADVTALNGTGINASSNTGTILIDTNAGSVSGQNFGVNAFVTADGTVSVTTADVTAIGTGISATSVGGDVTVDSSAGTISASNGISTSTNGIGNVSIAAADITATNVAITTSSVDGNIAVDTSAGSVSANGVNAINLISSGDGDISLTSANVTGGIFGVSAQVIDGDVTIDSSAGSVSADVFGINAVGMGTGNVSLTTADVTATSVAGIFTSANGGNIIIDSSAGIVTGASIGINANSYGAGHVFITTADVIGTDNLGIVAVANGGNITIDSSLGAVVGGLYGTAATTSDAGDVNITSGDASGGIGIYSSAQNGVTNITLISTADVTGTSGVGIFASSTGLAADITVQGSSGDIIGGTDGLDIDTMGADILVQNLDSVTGQAGDGIDAVSNGGDITITGVDAITGTGGNGILAVAGDGDISIQDSGLVGGITGTGSGSFNIGISQFNDGNGILAVTDGAINIGGIDAIGNINSSNAAGIGAYSNGGGIIIDTSAGSISADQAGIFAQDLLSDVSVTTADVSSSNGSGIIAQGNGDVSVDSSAGDVNAAFTGIFAQSLGSDAVTVKTANITTTGFAAVSINSNGGATVDTTSGNINGGTNGISVTNNGGATIINTDVVTGSAGNAIGITNGAMTIGGIAINAAGDVVGGVNGIIAIDNGSGPLSITSNGVTGGTNAIVANNIGTGDLTINAMGDIEGTSGVGIMAIGGEGGSNVAVAASGTVTGGVTGIYVDAGTGALDLDLDGDVVGATNGLITITQNGTNLTVSEGQTFSGSTVGIATMATDGSVISNDVLNILGTVDGAIMTFEGDDSIILADGSAVSGAIMLGEGNDNVTLDGGTFVALRGGAGLDSIDFNTDDTVVVNSGSETDLIAEFDAFNFNADGAVLAGTNTGLSSVDFNASNAILMGALTSSQVNIASAADLQIGDGTVLIGNLNNNGGLGVNLTSIGTFNIDGDFAQSATGNLTLDVMSPTSFDLINVTGDIALDGGLIINQGALLTQTLTLIDGDSNVTGSFATVSGLTDGLLLSQAIEIDAVNANVNLVASANDASSIVGLNSNQASIANALLNEIMTGPLDNNLNALTFALGSLTDVEALSAVLDELSPEIVTSNIDILRVLNNGFRSFILNQHRSSGNSASGDTGESQLESDSDTRIWGSVSFSEYNNDASATTAGYEADGVQFAAGISNIELGDIRLGVAGGYSNFDTIGSGGTRDLANTNLYQFGFTAATDFNVGKLDVGTELAATYGFGDNDLTMQLGGVLAGFGTSQSGNADFDAYGASFQLSLDGSNGKEWPLRPFVGISFDSLSQESVTLSGTGVTDIVIDEFDQDRVTFSYGVRFSQTWDTTSFNINASANHYTGDTQVQLNSSFFATGATGTSFSTLGDDIDNQFKFEAGLSEYLGGGWNLAVDGFYEFGDLEGYGWLINLSKKF